MGMLQKYLAAAYQASMKNRLGDKIVAVILGGFTFLIVIPFLLFLVGYTLERFVSAYDWILAQIAFPWQPSVSAFLSLHGQL